ncbi:hypothetical protein SOVF_053570 [Spinacia oleracea]|uniref:Uncharacterized protein YKR070W isoform X2 n=1 Tax=Spinacia oleracea TaxID=3562 RepID=A0A9R0K608_SPIOL|nr:uncharacterized protein YKR070W isoform X2 [Spinacia oleracea]KNA20312.1 hypothetical protein SOVF_053570 [Spinacia oleracea]
MQRTVSKLSSAVSQRKNQASSLFWRSFSHSSSRNAFGIAFDIDGVLIRGNSPIGGSPQALNKLYHPEGSLKVPYCFLTNGGGVRESKRAIELSKLFGVGVSSSQVLHGHSPFKQLAHKFENDFVVAVGKGEPAAVMSEYGFKDVISIDDYTLCFDNIDPLAPQKKWTVNGSSEPSPELKKYVRSQKVQAVFVVSDSVDWSRDIQVLCDILRTGGLPGGEIGSQPPLYFAHDDLKYQGAFPTERFGIGAFRISLQSVFNSIHPHPLQYSAVGKPNPLAFKNAETTLRKLYNHMIANQDCGGISPFETLYMIGDNPSVDIKGAQEAGRPWFSILTRTGVFRGKENDQEYPADMVVDTVEDAVDFILDKENSS